MSPTIAAQLQVEGLLDQAKALFKTKDVIKATIIIRNPGNPEEDFIVTDDDFDEVIKTLERRK